jgi:hypothetical protein
MLEGDFWGEVCGNIQEATENGDNLTLEEDLGIQWQESGESNLSFKVAKTPTSEADFLTGAEIQGRTLMGPETSAMQALTDKGRAAKALPLPVDAGSRVSFVTNLGSVLTYDDIPGEGMEGTVITVKTGAGKTTSQDGRVFVLWDDGKFRSIQAEHLRRAKGNRRMAQNVRMVVADFMDLTAFFAPTGSADELVHKATKDLWAVRDNGEGFVIERLFNDSGKPLKV